MCKPDADLRPSPGKNSDDPMCINFYCPSSLVCRRFMHDPYQGAKATVFIDPAPDLLGGLLCADFDPAELSQATTASAVGTQPQSGGVNHDQPHQ